ncbi:MULTISPECIES: hypothetical protein [unclassified Halobacteriovorax]|uniref:hypothetical protein n=1 Tax=unclassified Halobacteriovorax TaxID=2639665 RepID=UPI002FF4385F
MDNKIKPIFLIFSIIMTMLFTISSDVKAQETLTPLEDFTRQKLKEQREADEFRRFQTESSIGNGLNKGPHLIYLCSRRHFACVNNDTIRNCAQRPQMSCLIIKKFQNQKQCFSEQYEVMLKSRIDNFCDSVD